MFSGWLRLLAEFGMLGLFLISYLIKMVLEIYVSIKKSGLFIHKAFWWSFVSVCVASNGVDGYYFVPFWVLLGILLAFRGNLVGGGGCK